MSDVVQQVERLDLNDGDLLLLRGEFLYEEVKAVVEVLSQRKLRGVSVIVLGNGQSLDVLDVNTMREMGWVRLH